MAYTRRSFVVFLLLAASIGISAFQAQQSRRQALSHLVAGGASCVLVSQVPSPVIASDLNEDFASLQRVSDDVCQSLSDALSRSDFPAIMAMTKEYDGLLRKGAMGKIKKAYSPKESDGQPTALSNAVTFDLIGINKSSRPGSENPEAVARYITELRKDVNKFLALYEEAG